MWIRLRREELVGVFHYLGLVTVAIGVAMIVPLLTAVAFREWGPALDYLCGIGVALAVGLGLMIACAAPKHFHRRQAFITAAATWIVASLVAAVPLALSGNYASYLDALFDAVSGLTTSGLTLAQNLDHMAYAHNMWRHLTHLIGGQGIIVAAVSLAIGLKGGAISLYMAEARDERIFPNVVNTGRFIWFVTAVWLVVGTAAVFVVSLVIGMGAARGGLHAFWLTIATFDTGGFAPQSQNALYYHSWLIEAVTMALMLAGTLNFNLHADIWRGDRSEFLGNLEVRTLGLNLFALTGLATVGLVSTRLFSANATVLRKGLYHVISAASGTGHQTLYAAQWSGISQIAFFAVILAMALGGMASSTAGGIKALRVGLVFKAVMREIRSLLVPESAVVVAKFHHIKDRTLTSAMATSALIVTLMFVLSYVLGGLVGAAYGYPLGDALFESISATANVGLSVGITQPGMPVVMKVIYMFQMWAGRLEFFAVLTLLLAVVASLVPEKRGTWGRR